MKKFWQSPRRILWRILQLAVVAAIVGGVIYFIRFSPVLVTQHEVAPGFIVAEVMGTGTLEARFQSSISPKISGRIETIEVDQGQRVSKGELLVTLDDEEFEQQVAIAEANLAAAQAAINRIETDKETAVATYTQAKKSHVRLEKLVRERAVSQDELDKAAEALSVATTGISRADAAIAEANKQLIASQKTFDYHNSRLADSRVVAPFDGLIVTRTREPGDVVVPGSAILQLISMEQLWISAWVDETEMSRLAVGQPARIIFRSESEQDFEGNVFRLGKETDRETREFVVDVDVKKLPENWAVGQRAEAFIEVARKTAAILLPANLIVTRDGKIGVFINDAGVAVWQPIEIGLRNRRLVEVVSGLESGDLVVTPVKENQTLRDGRKVTIQ